MLRPALASAVLVACAAVRTPEEAAEALTVRRVAVSGGVMNVTDAPSQSSGVGAYVAASRPLWVSRRAAAGQLELAPAVVLGGSAAGAGMLAVGITFGAHLNLFRWLSLEAQVGAQAQVMVSARGVTPLVGMLGRGGYAFHPFDDHRRRFKLELWMAPSVAFGDTAPTDCPLCWGFFGGGLAYETPY